MKLSILSSVAVFSVAVASAGLAQDAEATELSFFVTSSTHSGDLGGLQGADATCQSLAEAAGVGDRTWKAYLSAHGTRKSLAVNARDRIGSGPWYNAKGVLIAASVADLHSDIQRDSNLIMQSTALTEKGDVVAGRNRAEGTSNEHDMLTGSDSHGRAFPGGAMRFNNLTCDNWTSGAAEGQAMIGHHDRMNSWNTSWNASHATRGCSLEALNSTGGAGRFYCFAAD